PRLSRRPGVSQSSRPVCQRRRQLALYARERLRRRTPRPRPPSATGLTPRKANSSLILWQRELDRSVFHSFEASLFLRKELCSWHHADNERTVKGKKETSGRPASGRLQIFPARGQSRQRSGR